jgi:hypothetical protein
MYHDVVEPGRRGSNRFRSRYELERPLFERHLAAISAARRSASSVAELLPGTDRPPPPDSSPLYLTFDDGDASALPVGELLAGAGWVGHFFIPVDFIGTPGYLDNDGIVALARMGHVIGSHSCSHTVPMTRLPEEALLEEWGRSVDVLSEIVGSRVFCGSVPGGYWSKRVAQTAARSGIDVLFTSDPTTSIREQDGALLLGRYMVLNGMSDETAARLAQGALVPRFRQAAWWKTKGAAKAILGDNYRRLRAYLLEKM